MNWIDAAAFALLIALGIIGFRRGIIDIIVIAAAYLAGLTASVALSEAAGTLLVRYAGMPAAVSRAIAAVAIFIACLLAVRGAGRVLKKLIALLLPGIDKTCGLLFGLFLASVVIALASIFLYAAPESSAPRELYENSFTARFVIRVLDRFVRYSPD